MDKRKWHILISVIIALLGIACLAIAESNTRPSAAIFWFFLRDVGLAFLVSAVPYAIFRWIKFESRINIISYLGTKRDAGPTLDALIMRAKKRIDVLGLSLNDMFSGSITPSILVKKLRRGCTIRLFVLHPDSSILQLRANDEGITLQDIKKSIVDNVARKWQQLSDLLADISKDHANIPGRLDLVYYESLPYFTLFRVDARMIIGLYNRNAACNTSVAFDISSNNDLIRKFEQDLDFLEGSDLVKCKAIHFRGGSGAVFNTIYSNSNTHSNT
jgi:hypothetical protein